MFFEASGVAKAQQASRPEFLSSLTYASPNLDELLAMVETGETPEEAARELPGKMREEAHLLITRGEDGVLLASKRHGEVAFREFLPGKVIQKNATGAGDSLCGGFLHALMEGRTVEDAVREGMESAELSLMGDTPISPFLGQ